MQVFSLKVYKVYLIKNLIKPFLFSTLVITGIVWLSRFIQYTKYIVEDGISITLFLSLTVLALPSLFLIIMPITTFIATILTYNKLISSKELFILKNAGIKNISIASPIIILSLLITLFSYSLTLYFSPKSNRQIRIIRSEMSTTLSSIIVDKEVFTEFKNITIYINDRDKDNNIYGLMLYERSEKPNEKNRLIYAKKAKINSNILELQDGNIQAFYNNGKEIPQMLFFDKYSIDIANYDQAEGKLRIRPADLYSEELFDRIKNEKNENKLQELISEANYRLTFPLYSFVLALIAVCTMLNVKLNRTGNSRDIFIATIIMSCIFGISLFLYQLAEDSITPIFIIIFIIFLTIVTSLFLIKERTMNAKL